MSWRNRNRLEEKWDAEEYKRKAIKGELHLLVTNQNRVAFHLAEFAALKAEIAEDEKSATANFRWAVAITGAIIAWIASPSSSTVANDPTLVTAAAWVPLGATLLLGLRSRLINKRFHVKGAYLRTLEVVLGHPQLGWEYIWHDVPAKMQRQHWYGWMVLVAVDAAFVVVGNTWLRSIATQLWTKIAGWC